MIKKIITSLIIIWISYVFLLSLPYKFTNHVETGNIFTPIWEWMKTIFTDSIWNAFINYWAIGVGIVELIASIILIVGLISLVFKKWKLNYLIATWGMLASIVMAWAIFFHTYTPLWIEVNWDGWSLFKAAVSILIFGIALTVMYYKEMKEKFCKK
jgi:hypothetical protein